MKGGLARAAGANARGDLTVRGERGLRLLTEEVRQLWRAGVTPWFPSIRFLPDAVPAADGWGVVVFYRKELRDYKAGVGVRHAYRAVHGVLQTCCGRMVDDVSGQWGTPSPAPHHELLGTVTCSTCRGVLKRHRAGPDDTYRGGP